MPVELLAVGIGCVAVAVALGLWDPRAVRGGALLTCVMATPMAITLGLQASAGLPVHHVVNGALLVVVCLGLGLHLDDVSVVLRHPVVISLGLYLAWTVLSWRWSSDPAKARDQMDNLLALGVIPGVLLAVAMAARSSVPGGGLVVLVATYALVFATFAQRVGQSLRYSVPDVNPIWLARSFVLLALVAIFAPGVSARSRAAVVIIAVPCVVATQERGPLVGFVVALGYSALTGSGAAVRRAGSKLLRSLALLGLLVVVVVFAVQRGDRYQQLTSEEALNDSSAESRFDQWSAAVELAADNPLVGIGAGAFEDATGYVYPHSLPLEVVAELGVVGLGLFVLSVFHMHRSARRAGWLDPVLVCALVFAMFSGSKGSNFEYVAVGLAAAGVDVAMRRRAVAASAEPSDLPDVESDLREASAPTQVEPAAQTRTGQAPGSALRRR